MTLKEYINNLQEFAKENPESLDLLVISSEDDEGNDYNPVYYTPSIGFYDGDYFLTPEEYGDWDIEDNETNAVCIN